MVGVLGLLTERAPCGEPKAGGTVGGLPVQVRQEAASAFGDGRKCYIWKDEAASVDVLDIMGQTAVSIRGILVVASPSCDSIPYHVRIAFRYTDAEGKEGTLAFDTFNMAGDEKASSSEAHETGTFFATDKGRLLRGKGSFFISLTDPSGKTAISNTLELVIDLDKKTIAVQPKALLSPRDSLGEGVTRVFALVGGYSLLEGKVTVSGDTPIGSSMLDAQRGPALASDLLDKGQSLSDAVEQVAGKYPNLVLTMSPRKQPSYQEVEKLLGKSDSTEAGVAPVQNWFRYGWCDIGVSDGKVVSLRIVCSRYVALRDQAAGSAEHSD